MTPSILPGRLANSEVPSAPSSLLDQAFQYAGRGWSIIATTGKKAAGLWKPFQSRPTDVGTLRRLFAKANITGLAVVTGRVSGGLAIRDFDLVDSYHAWAAEHPDDATRLPTVRSSRGYHCYGRLDEEQFQTLPDGELRADSRHYVLLPPSLHPDGPTYFWVNPLPADAAQLPLLPVSLTRIHGQSQHTHGKAAIASRPSRRKQTQHTQTLIAWWTSAVADTLPSGPGQRNRCIFELARRLKGIRPEATPAELRCVLREWHHLALPIVRTKDFDESWTDFAVAWERVLRPAGQSFATAAAAAAVIGLPDALEQLGYDGRLRRLAQLCWQLHRQWGGKPFPLGCAITGQYLGVSRRHAGRLLKALEFDGVLRLVAKGSKKSGKASEWRFILPEQKG